MNGSFDLFTIATQIASLWPSRKGFLFAIASILFADLFFFQSYGLLIQGIIFVLCSLLLLELWRRAWKLRKISSGKFGFLISIQCEDDAEAKRLRSDFTDPLRRLIKSGDIGTIFDFVELPNHIAQTVKDVESAELLRKKVGADFMIYGCVRVRCIDGVINHVMDIDGIVGHKAATLPESYRLSQEFSELLPRKVWIPDESELLGFQFTYEWTDIVSRYVIGLATYVSRDFEFSLRMYQDAQDRLGGRNSQFPIFRSLRQRIPDRIIEVHSARAVSSYLEWKDNKNPYHLHAMKTAIDEATNIKGKLPLDLHHLASIYSVVIDGDLTSSLNYLKAIKNTNDPLWNYNVAFVYCLKGHLKQAARHYRAASRSYCDPLIIFDIEDFMCWFLNENPSLNQIRYCLGILNWRSKGDSIRARIDFNEFLNNGSTASFPEERILAEKWINELHLDSIGG